MYSDLKNAQPGLEVSDEALKEMGLAVIDTEIAAVENLKSRIDGDFSRACRHMLGCSGRIVVTGMGKSGHIGGKIAATLASTGSPAFFVHPGEASHGDLGMITDKDVVLAISNSGETDELLTILPLIKRLGIALVAMTGKPNSTLAQAANAHLDIGVDKEACPLGLAPTASTTATLVMGDALAVALLEARGFTAEDFAFSHPGGALGRRLLLHVENVMHSGEEIPRVALDASMADTLLEMSRKGLGFAIIADADNRVLGVFTDGDLRRVLDQHPDVRQTAIKDVMTANCRTVRAHQLAAEALGLMESMKVNAFPVVDDHDRLVGALNMHDLLRAGVV